MAPIQLTPPATLAGAPRAAALLHELADLQAQFHGREGGSNVMRRLCVCMHFRSRVA